MEQHHRLWLWLVLSLVLPLLVVRVQEKARRQEVSKLVQEMQGTLGEGRRQEVGCQQERDRSDQEVEASVKLTEEQKRKELEVDTVLEECREDLANITGNPLLG